MRSSLGLELSSRQDTHELAAHVCKTTKQQRKGLRNVAREPCFFLM